jgi:hypothetical protein
MNNVAVPLWVLMLLSVSTDFIIAGGAMLTGAIVESGNKAMPSAVVILLAVLAGAVAAAKELRSMLKLSLPPETGK